MPKTCLETKDLVRKVRSHSVTSYPSKEAFIDNHGGAMITVVCTTAYLFPIFLSPSHTQPAQASSPLSAELSEDNHKC